MVSSILFIPFMAALTGAPQLFQDGLEAACEADSDHDRLANCVESIMQTSRFDPDTDSDGLTDGDEVFGTPAALDLPSLGANPRRRDVLVEIDWVDDNFGCAFHSHRPTPADIAEAQAIFAQIPIANPDGSTGINLIVDHGQGPPFSGGEKIQGVPDGLVSMEQLQAIHQPNHFAVNRLGYFRYSLHVHYQAQGVYSGGVAEGDANLISLGCVHDEPGYVATTLVHELGHNFGLQHGGYDACNRKPNYNSIMNYSVLYHGLDVDCDRFADGIEFAGFSDGSRRSLDKGHLIEADGVCPASHAFAKPIDWNFNGLIDPDAVAVELACPGVPVIHDWDDVTHMKLALFTAPGAAARAPG